MVRERVAENIYVFTSEVYAQVNAGAIVGPNWSVLIDTLALPEETIEIRDFLAHRLGAPVRYVINTHSHSDHSIGTYLFPQAAVLSSKRCRELLDTQGRLALQRAKQHSRELRDVEVVLPDIFFDKGTITVRVEKRTLRLLPLPGHTEDGIGVLVEEGRVLFTGDIMMPVPYLGDGDYDQMVSSLKILPRLKLENLVQGHGEVILRGEVASTVKSNLSYLAAIRREVRQSAKRKDWRSYLDRVSVEDCGKNRILLNGLVEDLHRRNLMALFHQLYSDR